MEKAWRGAPTAASALIGAVYLNTGVLSTRRRRLVRLERRRLDDADIRRDGVASSMAIKIAGHDLKRSDHTVSFAVANDGSCHRQPQSQRRRLLPAILAQS